MKQLKHISIFSLSLLLGQAGFSQQVYVRYQQDEGAVRLKWFTDALIADEGVDIFRSENGGPFEKITATPVKKGDHAIDYGNVTDEETTRKMVAAVDNPSFDFGANPMLQLVVLNAVIPSTELSQYLGIEYYDRSIQKDQLYQYRIEHAGTNAVIGTTESINTGSDYLEAAPTEIRYKQRNKSVSLGWKNESERYYGANIYRQQKGASSTKQKLNGQPIIYSGEEGKNSFQYMDKTVVKGVEYDYFLVSVDYFGEEGQSSASLTLGPKDIVPPPAPKVLEFSPDHQALSVGLSWQAELADDQMGFRVYHSEGDTSNFMLAREITKDTLYAVVKVPSIGKQFFRVSSIDSSGNESPYLEDFVYVEDKLPPAIPVGLTISADSGVVSLSWLHVADPDLEGYLIYRKKSSKSHYLRLTPHAIKENTFGETFPGRFVSDVTYQVVSKDTNGNISPVSETVSITFEDNNAPSAPQLQEINVAEDGVVSLNWLSPVNADLAGFTLYRSSNEDSIWKQVNLTPISAMATSFNDRGTDPGISYTYRLTAYDTARNESGFSNLKTITVPAEKQEIQILDFRADLNKRNKRVDLGWKVDQPENVRAYMVFASTGSDGTLVPVSGMIKDPFFQHTLESPGTTSFVVKAFDINGRKAISQPTSVTLENKN